MTGAGRSWDNADIVSRYKAVDTVLDGTGSRVVDARSWLQGGGCGWWIRGGGCGGAVNVQQRSEKSALKRGQATSLQVLLLSARSLTTGTRVLSKITTLPI